MMHLIINLALWVNNSCKWITVIFLNLCDNFLYYMICFCLLSLVFAFICLLSLSCLHISNTHPIPLSTLWIYSSFYTSNKKLFLTLPCFFLSLVPIIAQLPVNKEQTVKHYTNIFSNLYKLYSLSLYLSYLYNIRERVTNIE